MPIMLPPQIDEGVFCSEGERRFFGYLKSSAFDGYVLHSLVFDCRGQREIDYVLICQRGILCLEVKGGQISRRQREWIYTDHTGREHGGGEGPYKQAKENMHALRDRYRRHFKYPPIADVQFAWGVIFPDQPLNFRGADITEELTFDKRKGIDQLDAFIDACYSHSAQECISRNGIAGARIDSNLDLESVVRYMGGDFGYLPNLNAQLSDMENRLNVATDEQLKVLKGLRDNRRLLVSGGAGTGKTLIAAEHARNFSEEGCSVLFLCYNKLLKMHLENINPFKGVTYDNVDNYLYRHVYPAGDFSVPLGRGAATSFYRQTLPGEFVNLGGIPEELRYDAVIVDEAQDVLSECMLLCLDLMVKGGLSKGKAAIFYDAKQNIFNPGSNALLDKLAQTLREEYSFASFQLTKNCRNTRAISDFVTKATGVDAGEKGAVDGVKVETFFYENAQHQRLLLSEVVKGLLKQGIPQDDIAVVSHKGPKRTDSCFYDLSALDGVCKYLFIDGNTSLDKAKGHVKLATIQSFKGLESKALIVADVSTLKDGQGFHESLNYTSFSRAKAHLAVLAHKDVKRELSKALK